MDHFQGINPEERWKNDLLNEIRKFNERLSIPQALPAVKVTQEPKTANKKG